MDDLLPSQTHFVSSLDPLTFYEETALSNLHFARSLQSGKIKKEGRLVGGSRVKKVSNDSVQVELNQQSSCASKESVRRKFNLEWRLGKKEQILSMEGKEE